MYILFCTLYYT